MGVEAASPVRAGCEERWAVVFLALHEPAEPGWTKHPAVEPVDTVRSQPPALALSWPACLDNPFSFSPPSSFHIVSNFHTPQTHLLLSDLALEDTDYR